MASNPIATVVNLLTYNTYKPVRITKIECETKLRPGRRTAEIEAVELVADTVAPGGPPRASPRVSTLKFLSARLLESHVYSVRALFLLQFNLLQWSGRLLRSTPVAPL